MNEEERKEYKAQNNKFRQDVLSELVDAEIITQRPDKPARREQGSQIHKEKLVHPPA